MKSKVKDLPEEAIKVGRVYAGKRKVRASLGLTDVINDRVVLYINAPRTKVQYDSPSTTNGRHYPTVSMSQFVAWASEDVTNKMPEGDWRPYV